MLFLCPEHLISVACFVLHLTVLFFDPLSTAHYAKRSQATRMGVILASAPIDISKFSPSQHVTSISSSGTPVYTVFVVGEQQHEQGKENYPRSHSGSERKTSAASQ